MRGPSEEEEEEEEEDGAESIESSDDGSVDSLGEDGVQSRSGPPPQRFTMLSDLFSLSMSLRGECGEWREVHSSAAGPCARSGAAAHCTATSLVTSLVTRISLVTS